MRLCPLSFRLPRFEVQHLAVAVKSQHITLRDHAGVALLTSLLRGADVGFDGVVAKIGWSNVSPSATQKERTFGRLNQDLAARSLLAPLISKLRSPRWRDVFGADASKFSLHGNGGKRARWPSR